MNNVGIIGCGFFCGPQGIPSHGSLGIVPSLHRKDQKNYAKSPFGNI